MLPLIFGLMSCASPTEISRLMDETTKRHERIEEERERIRKELEDKRQKQIEEEEKIDKIIDSVFEELDDYNKFNGETRTQEIMMDAIDYTCERLKIDRLKFYDEFKDYLEHYYD